MSPSDEKFILRMIEPSDSSSVAALVTEFDGDLTTRFLVGTYSAIVCGTDEKTMGVVVECAGRDGLIGMGTVRFSQVQYNGELLPLAFLDGLKVREDFRRKGIGYLIANWRIQQAKEKYGDQCIIATGMLQENLASRAVARKWCREFIDPAFDASIFPVRKRQPKPMPGVTVREIEHHQFEEFSDRQNRFYRDYNLYSPSDANSIANALDISVEGKNPYRYYAAVDPHGNLLAGAQTWGRGLLKSDHINDPPALIHALNRVIHLLPPDFTILEVGVRRFWFNPDQMLAAGYLWEMIRWRSREQGTTVTINFDPRDPSREILSLRPWHQPRPRITIAIHAPSVINRANLIFAPGRV